MPRPVPDHTAAERHKGGRSSWVRAAVLGANDGLISTASLLVGVASAGSPRSAVLIAGVAGLVAGALSMAAGEYVSVSSQRDIQRADIARERAELAASPDAELLELAEIYERRGLSPSLAKRVAEELSRRDGLASHVRDELGIDIDALANPAQASLASALSFVVGAVVPVLVMAASPDRLRVVLTTCVTLVGLLVLGSTGARLGGAPAGRAALRVLLGGALALVASLGIGRLTGAAF